MELSYVGRDIRVMGGKKVWAHYGRTAHNFFCDKIGEKNNKIMGALWAPSPYLFFLIGVSKKVME